MAGSIKTVCTITAAALSVASAANAERAGVAEQVQVAAFQARSASGVAVERGSTIHQNARLYTKEYGSMDVRLDDGTDLTIAPNSSIVVDEYVFSGSGSSVGVSLARGALRMVSGRLPSESYSVKTDVATIGVRGTTFWVNTLADERVEIWTLDGVVTAQPVNSQTVFEFTAPAYAQCSATACEEGAAPPVPVSYPTNPSGSGNIDGRGEDGEGGEGGEL